MRDLSGMAFDSGPRLNRAQALRGDAAALAGLWAAGRVLALWRGRVAQGPEGLCWLAPDHPLLAEAAPPVFLGTDAEGRGRFAADISAWVPEMHPLPGPGAGPFDAGLQLHPALAQERGEGLGDLRALLGRLDPDEGEFAAMAKALTDWHRSHRFCSACGQPSAPEQAGWQRRCPACGAQHFPRTDPVVIMLVTRGNRALIGRSPGWPEGMYSCLAGFMEPGETIEAAVRREVAEETAVICGPVGYVASQPWPFPASLMIGCRAEALTEAITLDPVELEDALWISREEMAEVVAGRHPRIRAPRKGAIAQILLANWLAGRLD